MSDNQPYPSIAKYLSLISLKDNDFEWDATEDMRLHKVTIETSRPLSIDEKERIERFGAYHGGPAVYNFIASNCCYKPKNAIKCRCYYCTT